jgi:L-rhamnose mutarotase
MNGGKGRGVAVALIGSAVLLAAGCSQPQAQRHGSAVGIAPEHVGQYRRLLDEAGPGIRSAAAEARIDSVSLFLGEVGPGQPCVFAYCEYAGRNYERDVARMFGEPAMQSWRGQASRLETPLPGGEGGPGWAEWEEVFHHDGPAYNENDVTSRHGAIVGLAEEHIPAYVQLHSAVWPGVLATIDRINIRNYSIFLGQAEPEEYLLFAYFEYVGDDFAADMEQMADEVTRLWWSYTDPLQIRLPGTPEGQQWKPLERVF